MNRLSINVKDISYEIVIRNHFFSLSQEIHRIWQGHKIVIVTDQNVAKLYLSTLEVELRKITTDIFTYIAPAGEISKSAHTTLNIYNFLLKNKIDRSDLLVSLGGGVIGDITGFVASTYLRGVPFVQVPTTLLSQIDSSVGGKTAINYNGYKNILGSFYHPLLVYINTSVIKTLPKREYTAGLAESVVHALIADPHLLKFIEEKVANPHNAQQQDLAKLIYWNCKIKAGIISQDERDNNIRKTLNFGHTVGHALESFYGFKYRHGECVSVGIVTAFKVSVFLKLISRDKLIFIQHYLHKIGLPTEINNVNWEDIVQRITYDKKYTSEKVTYILPIDIGKVVLREFLPEELLKCIICKF